MTYVTEKATDQQIREAVSKSFSVRETLFNLGKPAHGTNHKHYSNRIKELGLDTSHFMFSRKGGYTKPEDRKRADDFLVLRPEGSRREIASKLRKALIEVGVEQQCSSCGLGVEWNGKALTLQIDHINGVSWDDRKENLRFLCPNCHTQTETYGPRKLPEGSRRNYRRCEVCNGRINPGTRYGRCSSCWVRKTKIEWPSREEVLQMIEDSNFFQVGKKLGVSDNAVRKFLKRTAPLRG